MEKGIRLDNNFISKVIFRIEFSTILQLSKNDEFAAEKFEKAISEKFPQCQVIPRNEINLNIDINSGQRQVFEKGDLIWVFKSEDNKREVILTANDLVLDYTKNAYEGFHNFLDEILLLVNALYELNHFNLKFLGLRYINQIDNSEIINNIEEYINPDLTNRPVINNLEKNNEDLVQIFSKINFKKENYLLTLQYGLFNPNFPDPSSTKEFVLDYDCVCTSINSPKDICYNLKEMNKLIFDKFEYSITQKFEEYMKEE